MGDARQIPWQKDDPELITAKEKWERQKAEIAKVWAGPTWSIQTSEPAKVLADAAHAEQLQRAQYADWLRQQQGQPLIREPLRSIVAKVIKAMPPSKSHFSTSTDHRTCAYRQSNGAEKCTC